MPFRATPLEALNDAICGAARALAERERVRREIASHKSTLSRLNQRVRLCKARLRAEERRRNHLDRLTPAALLHGVLGTLELRRREQQHEWQRIRDALLHAMAERDALAEEVRRLQGRAQVLERAPELLDEALARKAAWLRAHDGQASARLLELEDDERALRASLARIERALEGAGRASAWRGGSAPPPPHQLAILRDMHARKRQRLRALWQERSSLLLDGAQAAARAAHTLLASLPATGIH